MFGAGYTPVEAAPQLADGNYKARIKSAEIKNGNYGQYVVVEVELKGENGLLIQNANPHNFLLNERPTQGFGSLSAEDAQKMWDRNMTLFFDSFQIQRGDFNIQNWVRKVGDVTVQAQRKKPQFKEILPYKATPKPAQGIGTGQNNVPTNNVVSQESATPTVVTTADFPEDIPF